MTNQQILEISLFRFHARHPGESGTPVDGHRAAAIRQAPGLAVLPLPRGWGLWVGLYSLVVLVIGFSALHTPGFSRTEFSVDQGLSRHHNAALTVLALSLNYVFSPAGGLLMIAALCFYLLLARKSAAGAWVFGGTATAGWLSSQIFKVIVDRPRPDPVLLHDPLAPETGFNSFPSGHVALAVGLGWAFYFLARRTRWAKVSAWAGILVSLLVAWSRLYLGVHYPTDVVASFLAATAAVLLFAGLWNHALDRGLHPRASPGPPAPHALSPLPPSTSSRTGH